MSKRLFEATNPFRYVFNSTEFVRNDFNVIRAESARVRLRGYRFASIFASKQSMKLNGSIKTRGFRFNLLIGSYEQPDLRSVSDVLSDFKMQIAPDRL